MIYTSLVTCIINLSNILYMSIIYIFIYLVILYILLKNYALLLDYHKPILDRINKKGSKLKILDWNIKMLPYPIGNGYLRKIRNYVDKVDPDVICFQECFSCVTMNKRRLVNLFKDYNYVMSPISLSIFKGTCSGLLILSKYKINEYIFESFHSCNSEDCIANKGILGVRIKNTWIITLHLQHEYTSLQFVQLRQVKRFLRTLYKKYKSSKFIVVGDFNIDIDTEKVYDKLIQTFEGSPFSLIVNDRKVSTFCSHKLVIDYVLTNSNDVSYQLINKCDVSDHKPLILSSILQ